MAAAFFPFLFCLYVCFQLCDSRITGQLPYRFNFKCKSLKLELIRDALRKIQSLQYLKKSQEDNFIFHLGVAAAETKVLYSEIMGLYVDMENMPTVNHQLDRTRKLVQIQRKAMHAENFITMMEEGEHKQQRRSEKAKVIENSLRTKNETIMAKKTANKTALRAVMKNITQNKMVREWPKIQPQPNAAAAKLKPRQDYGGFEYDYGGQAPRF